MAAIPIQAPSRFGGRDYDHGPLPSLSRREESFPRQPFGTSDRHMPYPDILSPSAASNPMSIRRTDTYGNVPPPLPPPPLVPISGPVDPAIQNKRYQQRHDEYSSSEAADSFGLDFKRRDLSFKNNFPDEGYQSMDSSYRPPVPAPFGFPKTFRQGDSIDNSMLSKLNRPVRRSGLSASVNEGLVARPHHSALATISLPDRSKTTFFESGFTKSPLPLSAVSPRHTPFSQLSAGHQDYRSPVGTDGGDLERSPALRTRRLNSGSVADDATVSTQGSFEGRDDDIDFPMEETSRLRGLQIEDQWRERERERERDYYQAGQKRRASSPPGEDLPMASDQVRRRDGGIHSRGSPTPRLLTVGVPQGSISSVSSAGRSGSYAGSVTASSMTSLGSFGRRSPNGISPGGLSPTDPMSPFATPISLTASPRSAVGRSAAAQPPHSRTFSEHTMAAQGGRTMASPRKLQEIPKNPNSLVTAKLKGPYMCECCPKKPKKFETEEELKLHEAEKQYECSYCGNRFKNKNEAERHQNSLHVRRHSWSCSALTCYDRAFHDSTTRPGEADTCGYCGDEFPRTGRSSNGGFVVNEQDWEERARHLQDIHKFRECNSSKKFFRADHFRQHLKHSHAGTSGKWTNMLENACMMEEDPPVPR